jgi:predicted deacylase
MRLFSAKRIIALILILLIISVGVFSYFIFFKPDLKPIPEVVEKKVEIKTTIGLSVEGRKIEAYTYGSGENHLLFVGGIHGGYEWNSVLLAYQFMDYLNAYPEIIPKNITVTVIPSANPDGVYKVINKEGKFTVLDVPITSNLPAGTGRFNSNGVDLNRNFDCKWQATSTWKQKIVSAGTFAFSEPEAKAIQKFILVNNPEVVIFWHSQSNAVYASECKNGILPETLKIMNTYSKASGYPAISTFDSYEITGDAEGWLASINIPAITVELKTHEGIEWDKNIAGILSVFDYYKLK